MNFEIKNIPVIEEFGENGLPKSRAHAKEINSLHYYDAFDCKRNHGCIRLTSTGHCVECRKITTSKHKASEKCKQTDAEYYKKNKDRIQKYLVLRRYNLTEEKYNSMLLNQNNSCAICKKPFTHKSKINVDHCHKSTKVRGLLCYNCNLGLGKFLDSVLLLNSAARYLNESK